jgi:hypothetical protein
MKTRKLATAIALSLILASCAKSIWVKPGATQEDFRRDSLACRQYGMQSAMANGLSGNMFVEGWIAKERDGCLRDLGWTETFVKRQ